ncbi:hypothetical protein F2P81_001971 [Scophthalmus maximus]|uniref:Uncharacterized protein n=1 Tax=Scophthalmus maximus TaxID=52904 RepID=A0A6A4TTV3_SCOMX|nr:hypothetical protein F2P81_001971 [Scophthalmus maximus]
METERLREMLTSRECRESDRHHVDRSNERGSFVWKGKTGDVKSKIKDGVGFLPRCGAALRSRAKCCHRWREVTTTQANGCQHDGLGYVDKPDVV